MSEDPRRPTPTAADTRPEPAAPARPARQVLHVGCGPRRADKLHPLFRGTDWREIRLDIDPATRPDILASIADMPMIASESVDAIWSSHNLEHLFDHEVPSALAEFHRVLGPQGFLLVTMPDLEAVVRHVATHGLETKAYDSPSGPVAPLDMIYGYRPSIARGAVAMAHHTGFTRDRLGRLLVEAGFAEVHVWAGFSFDLWGLAVKDPAVAPVVRAGLLTVVS